jgi:hypothetical protein
MVLTAGTTKVLLNLFKPGLYFPASTIVFNNLLDGEIKIGRKESHPAYFSEVKWFNKLGHF